MRANRVARERPSFRDDERGVSEAVGYIITFGISTIVLVTSLQAFLVIQRHTNDVAVDRSVKEVAAQVAFAIEEALRAGATYPDASFSMAITVPRELSGTGYRISLYSDHLWVESIDAQPEAFDDDGVKLENLGRARADFVERAQADVLCSSPADTVPNGVCSVLSQEGEIVVVYQDPDGPGGPETPGVYFKRDG